VGTSTSPTADDGVYARLIVQGNHHNGTSGDAAIYIQRGESPTQTSSGDPLGTLGFSYAGGITAASIICRQDGNSGTNDHPSRLAFTTTADGASSPTERMRISPKGRFSTVSSDGAANIFCTTRAASSSDSLIVGSHSSNGDIDNGTNCFVVRSNGNTLNTNNSYTGLSDIKLKENIVDSGLQWDDIKGIRVRKYNFKESTNHETFTQLGVIAQEVELVSPGLVSESPDRDVEGNELGTVTKSVNYSVLYMKAVKALQEAMERIETLETKVAALEAG
jgi:hypothetical protein